MADMTDGERDGSTKRRLDTAPPRPPRNRQNQSVMSLASDSDEQNPSSLGIDSSSPAIQAMQTMGRVRQEMLKLASQLPNLSQGIQQILSGLEQVVPQQVADLISGNPAGSGGSSMGAPQAAAAPTAPPVQQGMQ